MTKAEFILIAEKVSNGSANAHELAQYNCYHNQYQRDYPVWDEYDLAEKEEIQNNLSQRINAQIMLDAEPKTYRLWPKIVTAASVIMVLSFGVYFHQKINQNKQDAIITKTQDISPGSNKAFLTLADGKRISLDDQAYADLAEQPGITITKTADGKLIYKVDASANAAGTNVIETPLGGQYQVQLPDGTNVWLNAASSMKYPLKLSGKKRIVEINGEAYFEVAHNPAMPFVVKTSKQEIEVLGTHFNVMAYNDEPEVETTLVQGSVKITTAQNALLLKPGQQAVVAKNSVVLNPNADIESAVAWRAGKIQFSDMNIQHIVRMLARWYDFEADFQTKQLNMTFGGSFSRNKNLSTILKSLESTGDVHFKIEGRRVVVMP